jgi:quinoprotein glucose dehydrogenase
VQDTGVLVIRDGAVVTAGGLIFIATNREGKLRAYDEETGKKLWVSDLPAGSEGIPAVYESNGREYLAICVSSPKGPSHVANVSEGNAAAPSIAQQTKGSYVVYALPEDAGTHSDQVR